MSSMCCIEKINDLSFLSNSRHKHDTERVFLMFFILFVFLSYSTVHYIGLVHKKINLE
jgi:hypothetical protein